MKEVSLPSGATLKIGSTPFAASKALYQAILEEVKNIQISTDRDLNSLLKDAFCLAFSSKKIDVCLAECMKRCMYNDLKIDEKTFEPEAAREDYTKICIAVIEENITPFMKGLSAELNRIVSMIPSAQA